MRFASCMKNPFRIGDQKTYRKKITEEDRAVFHGDLVHSVCSTFALARDFEWSSRLFFLEMKESDEEGVGTHVSVDHKAPAFVGEEIIFTATIEEINGTQLNCVIEARVGERLVASGRTGQRMLKKERLREWFSGTH
jgi:fluoroacetyl-CoA thioesterase